MKDRQPRRRDVLKTVGAGAFVGALAGCSGQEGGAGTDAPTDAHSESDTTDTSGGTEGTPTEAATEPTPTGPTAGVDACPVGPMPDDGLEEIGGSITEDRTLGADADGYRVTETLDVSGGANLTIEPGTKLEFAPDTGIYVSGPGSLTAAGTCEDPILFTGDQELPGTWAGIVFDESNRTENELGYCRIEYGGDQWEGANLATWGETRLAVHDCTLSHGETLNFAFVDTPTITDFSKNVVTASDGYAGKAQPDVVQGLSKTSTYVGNSEDYVKVWASSVGEDYEGTWDGLDVPYRLVPTSVSTELSISGDLTIGPGARIEAEEDVGITAYENASFRARGVTETDGDDQITFTGVQNTAGYWRGISFDTTDSSRNELTNVVVEYAGAHPTGSAYEAANVTVIRGARAILGSVTLRNADGNGLYLGHDVTLSLSGSELTANTRPAYVHATSTHHLDTSTTYTGNDTDVVTVRRGWIEATVTWENLGVPYRLVPNKVGTELTIQKQGHLTIAPGTTVEFTEDTGIRATGNGAFTADASGDDPITFTGAQKQKGHWGGIFYVETGQQENILRNCVVEYAGAYPAPFGSGKHANVGVSRNGGHATVENCTIRHGAGAGMHREDGATWTIANNTFDDIDGQNTVVTAMP